MKRLIILFAATVISVSVYSQATVFKVTKGDRFCYIGGTVHILSESNYPLPSEYDQAYAKADVLVIETDTASLTEPENMQALMQMAVYPDGETIAQHLSSRVYKKLTKTLGTYSIPVAGVAKLKPGLLSSVITAIQFQQMGYTAEGVDSFYYNKAVEDNKDVLFLESLNAQIDFLCSMGEGIEDEFILSMLEDMDKTKEYMDAMVASWEKGESEVIETSAQEMKAAFPEIYKTLLSDRNRTWIDLLNTYLEDKPIEFVLFGAMHLYGEDGVLELLKADGCVVEQLGITE